MPKKPEKSHDSLTQGRVIAYFGSTVLVETSDARQVTCHWRRNQCLPVVGDEVQFLDEATGEGGVIQAILPRKTTLIRATHGGTKPIAANVDYLTIVMAPPPIFSGWLVDRYTVAAELLGIKPLLVINKIDLLDAAARTALEASVKRYRDIPYPVFFTSTKTGEGLAALEQCFAEHTAVLVGPSGVGKSSLISHWLEETLRVGDVSHKGTGKHTTTATHLYPLPCGGALIDSPGVREFGLWTMAKADVARGFPEFRGLLTGCQFRDCSHAIEPGCAVQAAMASGRIAPERYDTFQTLMRLAK